jgi:hypothetical protein
MEPESNPNQTDELSPKTIEKICPDKLTVDSIHFIPDAMVRIFETPEGKEIWEALQNSDQGLDILLHLTPENAMAWLSKIPLSVCLRYLYLQSDKELNLFKQWLRNLLLGELEGIDSTLIPTALPLRFDGTGSSSDAFPGIDGRFPITPEFPLHKLIYGDPKCTQFPGSLSRFQKDLLSQLYPEEVAKCSVQKLSRFLVYEQKMQYNLFLFRRFARILIGKDSSLLKVPDPRNFNLFMQELSKCVRMGKRQQVNEHLQGHIQLLKIASLDQEKRLKDETSIAGILGQMILRVPEGRMDMCIRKYMQCIQQIVSNFPKILPETAMWGIQDIPTLNRCCFASMQRGKRLEPSTRSFPSFHKSQ